MVFAREKKRGALAFSLYAIVGVGTEALLWGGVLIIAGLPIYFWLRLRRAIG